MNDMGVHIALFLFVGLAIVYLSAVYSEPHDSKALQGLPRRLLYFVFGCGALTAVMLVCQHLFASLE